MSHHTSRDALVPLGRPGPGRPAVRERVRRSSTPSSARRTPRPSTPPTSGSPSRWARSLLDELRGIVGAEHVLTDHETRLHRTRGKSTPDLLRLRAGDGSDSPDAVVRPGTHEEVAALIAWARRAPRRAGALRRRHLGRRRPGRPPRGLRRRRLARPGPLRPAARRRHRLDDRDARARPPRPAGRGAARRARPDARPLPAVLRVRLDRRLRGHPLLGPVLGRLRPLRLAGRRPARRDAPGRARARQLAGQRRRTRPARGGDGLRGRLRGGHRRHRARAPRARGEGLRDLALGLLRRRRRGDAHPRPGRRAADRAAALRRGRDLDQPRQAGRGRRRVRRAAA